MSNLKRNVEYLLDVTQKLKISIINYEFYRARYEMNSLYRSIYDSFHSCFSTSISIMNLVYINGSTIDNGTFRAEDNIYNIIENAKQIGIIDSDQKRFWESFYNIYKLDTSDFINNLDENLDEIYNIISKCNLLVESINNNNLYI